ncbi:hypothetical protein NUACC26_064820 [Scytonema sp. NUACC26]
MQRSQRQENPNNYEKYFQNHLLNARTWVGQPF